MKRGDIYICDLGVRNGSVQQKTRPVIIVQNNVANKHSPNTIIVPLTTKLSPVYPTNIIIHDLDQPSKALCDQVRVVSKKRIHKKIGTVQNMRLIDRGLQISLGLIEF